MADENLEIINLEGFGPVVTLRQIILVMQGMKVDKPAMDSTIAWVEELNQLGRTCEPVLLETAATVDRNNLKQVDVPVRRTIENVTDDDLDQVAASCGPPTLAPDVEVIRVEISGEGLGNPRSAAELSDLLYGIDDGNVDGSVKFLD